MMRRLQSNLAYLAQNVERRNPHQPPQPGPAIMSAPSGPPELVELYTKLQGLYPGWKGQQIKASPGPQQRMGSIPQTPSNPGGMSTPMNHTGHGMVQQQQHNNTQQTPTPQMQMQQQAQQQLQQQQQQAVQ
jgi:hypothetical protein